MSLSERRFLYLDGLRAFAAFMVVIQHSAEFSYLGRDGTGPGHVFFSDLFNFGRYGVAVFFLISGFLIPSSVKTVPNALRSFAIGRFFRLYPVYWASLFFAVLTIPLIRDQHFPVSMVMENMTMFQMLHGGINANVIPAYWTLFVEMLFYIICACLFALGLLHRVDTPLLMVFGFGFLVTITSIGLLLNFGYGENVMMKIGTLSVYFILMFLGQLLRSVADGKKVGAFWEVLFVSLIVLFYCAVRQITARYEDGLPPLGVLTATLGAVYTFLLADRLNFLRLRIFTALGAVSYGVYLFHHVANVWVRSYIPFASTMGELLVLVGSVAILSIIAATVAYYVIEKPGIAVGRALNKALGSRVQGAA